MATVKQRAAEGFQFKCELPIAMTLQKMGGDGIGVTKWAIAMMQPRDGEDGISAGQAEEPKRLDVPQYAQGFGDSRAVDVKPTEQLHQRRRVKKELDQRSLFGQAEG